MVDRTKVIEMLSRGYSQTVIAAAVGCTDSYISQLVAEPEVRDEIGARRLEVLEKRVEQDDSIESLETLALARVHRLLPLVTNPLHALRIFEVANKAERKTKQPETADQRGVVVNIVLPEAAMVHFKLSAQQQVVEVDGRSMATLPAQQLNKRLQDRQNARIPQITDATSALELLKRVEIGVPEPEVLNVLQPS